MIAQDPDAVHRIQQEVSVLQELRHNHIVELFAFHENQEKLALELEYVDGSSLKAWNKEFRVDLIEPRLWILSRIARALGFAHEKRILHRDLKPENILVSKNGEVKLTDFGLARSLERVTMTKSGVLLGSLGYMAPEILNLETANERSDVFSFGVIAYELLSNRMPFEASSPQGVIKRLSEGRYTPLREVNPLVPEDVARCIQSCLSIKPEERPENIWVVESTLMTTLAKGTLMNVCGDLVSVIHRDRVLQKVLQGKLNVLTDKIKWALDQNKIADVWNESQEYQRLFPQGELMPQILESVVGAETQKKVVQRWTSAFVLLLFVFVGLGIWWWVSTWGHKPIFTAKPQPVVEPPPPPTQPGRVDPETQRVAAPAVAQQKPRPTRAVRSAEGFLRFDIPADVDVYVDGQLVPKDKLKNFATTPGEKNIRMVKEGFLPIDSKLTVRDGKTSTIRAGAQ